MLFRFFLSNIHFTLSVFSAFVFFITALLYFDSAKVGSNNKRVKVNLNTHFLKAFRQFFDKLKSWALSFKPAKLVSLVKQFGFRVRSIRGLIARGFREVENKNLAVRGVGFLLLSFLSAVHATSLNSGSFLLVAQFLEMLGLIIILTTLVKEPAVRPLEKTVLVFFPISLVILFFLLVPATSVLYLVIALIYLRKVNENYEKQFKPVFLAFLFLAIAEILNIGFFWSETNNVFLSNFLADFGFLWGVTHLLEFIGVIILAKWTLGYFRFKLASELFITTVSAILVVFLVTTIFFTFLLFKNVEQVALAHLETDTKVLQFALERLEKEALSDGQTIAADTTFLNTFWSRDKKAIYKVTSGYLISQGTSFLAVTDASGNVLMRGEDKEKMGDNLKSDLVVNSALSGQKLSTVTVRQGVFLPLVEIKAAIPIKSGSQVAGSVVTGFLIDDAFVDGVKQITGLDVTVFADRRRAATTFLLPDGKSRAVGTIESNAAVISKVLEKGEMFIGPSQVLNQSYYTAYAPLKTYGDKTIGMLFVGKPQTELIKAADRSLNLTFMGSILLMIVSLIPAYYISKYLSDQIKA